MADRSSHKERLADAAASVSQQLNATVTFLNEPQENGREAFLFDVDIPGTESSISDLISRISIVCDQISGIPSTAKFSVVPIDWVNDTVSQLDGVRNHLVSLVDGISSLVTSNGSISSIDSESFQINFENGTVQESSRWFLRLNSSVEALLSSYYRLATVVRPSKSSLEFRASASMLKTLVAEYTNQISNLKSEREKLEEQLAEVEASKSRAESWADNSETSASEAARHTQEAKNERTTLAEYLAEATQNHESISAISEEADGLQNRIKSSSQSLNEFDEALEKRVKALVSSEGRLKALTEALGEKDSQAGSLIAQSEAMLKGATVAGLAYHYQEIYNALDGKVHGAARSFNFGILFLFISLIPLLALVLAPIINPLIALYFPDISGSFSILLPEQGETGWQFVGQVLARFIILLPAAWYVRFASIRHSSLFRLREHYNYKYSMAVSVEGFKQQAPKYSEEIAAITLEQLAFNPVDKLVPSNKVPEGKAPNPLLRYLDRLVNKQLDNLSE